MPIAGGGNHESMYECGITLSKPDRSRIVINIPVTHNGTTAASRILWYGVRVCLMAFYALYQSITESGVGAEYLSPYLGHMIYSEKGGMAEFRQIQYIGRGTRIRD